MSVAFKRIRDILGGSLTVKEVFTSRKFATYFSSLVKMVSERYQSPIRMHMKWDEEDETVACTDNRMIYINLANSLVADVKDVGDKYLVYTGLLAHELGHVLFTDFTSIVKAIEAFQSKSWYPERPVFTEPEDIAALANLESFVFGPDAALILKPFVQMLASTNNCLEDRYVNQKMMKLYPGNFKSGIELVSHETVENLKRVTKSVEEEANVVGNLMLLACYTQKLPKSVLKKYPIFNKVLPLLREIDTTDAPSDRLRLSNKVLVLLWSFYEQMFKNDLDKFKALQELFKKMIQSSMMNGQNGEGQEGQGQSGQGISKEMREVLEKIAKAMGGDQQSQPSTSQMGKGRGICCDEQEQQSEKSRQSSGSQKGEKEQQSDKPADSSSKGEKPASENEGTEKSAKGKSERDESLDEFLKSLDEAEENAEKGSSKGGGDDGAEADGQHEGDGKAPSEGSDDDSDGKPEDEAQGESEAEQEGDGKDQESNSRSNGNQGDGEESEDDSEGQSGAEDEDDAGDESGEDNGDDASPSNHELSGDTEIGALDGPAPHVDEAQLSKTIDELLSDVTQEVIQKDPSRVQDIERKQCCNEVCEVDVHRNVKHTLTTPQVILSEAKPKYENAFNCLKGISKRLQRSINDALEDKREGCVEKGLLHGNRINPAAAAGNDGKIFKRNRLPEDYPILAVSVLIDESGSMSGNRIRIAMQTAMILEDFCRGLDIPIAITGHSVRTGVFLKNYVDFEETNKNAKYRLTDMAAGGCNRDGFALRYCIKRLQQRDEPTKLLILISDGRPSDTGYGGDISTKDLQAAQRDCKKLGITLFTAAIGDDKPHIQQIYGNAFLDISNLNKLPEKMVALVRKFID